LKIKTIDFPEELLKAQTEGTLVIFAGAGVSMEQPSNYPNFDGLVDGIAKWARKERLKEEPPERFLGRLDHENFNIHQQVVKVLSSPKSKHNTLHENLLKLFRTPDQVKIVTTNFDVHFDSASLKVFEDKMPKVFKAPALPLGNDFSGIVYLHGSVDEDPKKLVLTDQDFGRAYLTEGWATRFLLAMFSRYTVLFIGYSHDDTVMHYLSRGLPPKDIKSRFAIVRDDKNFNEWGYRGIKTLLYPVKENTDHSQLGTAISSWAEHAKRGALETEQRIKEYVTGLPPSLDDEAKDYLKWAVKDIVTLRFFVRYAKNPEWLIWGYENKILDPLFSQENLSQIDKELSSWIVNNFVIEHCDTLFLILADYKKDLNPWFVNEITHYITIIEPIPEKHVISKWVPIQIQHTKYSESNWLDSYGWVKLLKRTLLQDALIAATQLFEFITKPKLNLKKRIPWYKDELDKEPTVSSELEYLAEYSTLNEVWEIDIKPRLSELAIEFWPITIQNLNHAYHLLKSWDEPKTTWDPISWSRAAIEHHKQNTISETVDVLINSARDCLEWALLNFPQVGQSWIEYLSAMEPLIFKRLAIHGISFTSYLIANDKIKWVLDKNILFVHGLKHEVFQLLKNAYPKSDLKWKKILLDESIRKIDDLTDQEGIEKKEYIKFNFLYWLSLSAPDCQEVAIKLALIKKAHPNFEPREHPDLDHYFYSGQTGVGSRSPVSVEELQQKKPSEWLEYFMTFKGNTFDGPDRGELMYSISKAIQQNFEWGSELADLLIAQNKLDSDVLGSVIRGWYDIKLSEKQWEYILTILDNEDVVRNHLQYIANLLQYGVKNEADGIPIKLLLKADGVALKIWTCLHKVVGSELVALAYPELSHLGGELAMFWMYSLSRSRKDEEQNRTGIFQPYRDRFEAIINGNSKAAAQGREMLASQLGFIFSVDQEWSRMNIIPLFDWNNDVNKARQVWKGWLSWGRLTEPLLDELIPFFQKSFQYISTEFLKERERLVEWIVNISLFWMDDPLSNGWIIAFLQKSEEQDRKNFASQIGHHLMNMKLDTKIGLWKRWLKRYWEDRNQGIPVPMADDELKKIVEWSSELGCVFPDVAEIICNGPVPKPIQHTSLFYRLEKKESEIIKRYPDELTRLLIHLTTDTSLPYYFCKELEKLTEKIITAGVQRDLLFILCNNLAAIGCSKASELSHLGTKKNEDK
jgi:hypothetical protein